MKKRQFTEEQILSVLGECGTGAKLEELCSKHGISRSTIARWRSKYGDPAASAATRLRRLEEENRRLRSLVADLTLSNQALKMAVSKKW